MVRDGETGLEVLLLQRTWEAVFFPGYFVFPGGAVDDLDGQARDHLAGFDDAAISRTLSLDEGGADYMIASLRECFEEAGLLLAVDEWGRIPGTDHLALILGRTALLAGEQGILELCRQHGLTLPLDRLAYVGHWITRKGAPRRFDTRFFVARSPEGQQVEPDGSEIIGHAWLAPGEALIEHRAGRRLLGHPTMRTLRYLANFKNVEALLYHAHANPPAPRPSRSWPAHKGGKRWLVEPDAPAYVEVRKLDSERRGTARAEILPGEPVTLAPGVVRLTAPNPGVMTGSGTNSYLLGEEGDWAVIDPGPLSPEHLERLLAVTGGQITKILVTHTHRDHSEGAAALKANTGAQVLGMPSPPFASQDTGFSPDLVPCHGGHIKTAAGTLRVLHTPGHASNHLCYLLLRERLLFSGDQVMQGSTVVINPPDGDMAAYLDALHALLEESIDHIAPGHGFLIGQPHSAIDFLITHRLAREHKVFQALARHEPATLRALTRHVYDDVPEERHGIAEHSAEAHLLKLERDGRARRIGDHWLTV
tara:strand:+ start:8199 stop:9803 length:1605 start_codon:yes stop_codon:yes gene_type:complete